MNNLWPSFKGREMIENSFFACGHRRTLLLKYLLFLWLLVLIILHHGRVVLPQFSLRTIFWYGKFSKSHIFEGEFFYKEWREIKKGRIRRVGGRKKYKRKWAEEREGKKREWEGIQDDQLSWLGPSKFPFGGWMCKYKPWCK